MWLTRLTTTSPGKEFIFVFDAKKICILKNLNSTVVVINIQLLYKPIMSYCLDRLSTDPEQFLGLSHVAKAG